MATTKTIGRTLFVAALVLLGGLATPATARAAVLLNFSDISSDLTPVSALRAQAIFQVVGNELRIGINNQSAYRIAGLYFNTDITLLGLSLAAGQTPAWSVQGTGLLQSHRADGMGLYNFFLDFGSGTDRLEAGWTFLTLRMNGLTGENVIGNKWSVGSTRLAISVMKFEAGPGDDSAFGGTRTPGINPVPEPSTVVLALSGLAAFGVAGLRRWRQASPAPGIT